MLPIDIYEGSVDSEYQEHILNAWIVIYYINFFTCWIILPFAQEYEDSGHFTFAKKMREALIMNGILIGVLVIGAIIIALFMLIKVGFSFSQIPATFATLVNLFGLVLVSIFLGFGLASFPK